MDVNLINPVIEAFNEVLSQFGFQEIKKNNLQLSSSTISYSGVLLNISIVGTVKGVILIGMSEADAEKFASKMMMGMPVTALDDMSKSALSEMSNMVCANACTHFNKINIKNLNISPPTLLISESNSQATIPVDQAVIVTFLCDGLKVNLYIGLV